MDKNSKPKYMAVVKQAKMTLYKHGAISTRATSRLVNITGLTNGRKVNKGCFSLAARRRLRSWVVSNDVPNSGAYALTLTLPGNGLYAFPTSDCLLSKTEVPLEGPPLTRKGCKVSPQCIPLSLGRGFVKDFSETVRRFGNSFRRLLPHSGFAWRVELQQRGAPHLHCLVYVSRRDFIPEEFPGCTKQPPKLVESARHWWLRRSLCWEWWKSVIQTCWVGSAEDAKEWLKTMEHHCGFDLRPLWNHQGIVRYIVDDMTKHKLEQLGYRGAQWGIVARSNWRECRLASIDDAALRAVLQRALGKMRRRRQKFPGQFGYRLSKYYPADSGATYGNEDTLLRLLAWAKDTISQKQSVGNKPFCTDGPKGNLEEHRQIQGSGTLAIPESVNVPMISDFAPGEKYLHLLLDSYEPKVKGWAERITRRNAPRTTRNAPAHLDLCAYKITRRSEKVFFRHDDKPLNH